MDVELCMERCVIAVQKKAPPPQRSLKDNGRGQRKYSACPQHTLCYSHSPITSLPAFPHGEGSSHLIHLIAGRKLRGLLAVVYLLEKSILRHHNYNTAPPIKFRHACAAAKT